MCVVQRKVFRIRIICCFIYFFVSSSQKYLSCNSVSQCGKSTHTFRLLHCIKRLRATITQQVNNYQNEQNLNSPIAHQKQPDA